MRAIRFRYFASAAQIGFINPDSRVEAPDDEAMLARPVLSALRVPLALQVPFAMQGPWRVRLTPM
jgi:hypothetical protein